MNLRSRTSVFLCAVALVGAGAMTATAPVAQAADRDGVCESGEFCYYYNSNHQGSVSDFRNSVGNYGDTQPSCYEFKGSGSGKGRCIKNDAASAWNRTNQTVTVYYNTNYGGATQTFKPGEKANLNATLKNNNASHRIGGTTTPDPGRFRLPFPCGETWQAGTRSNHSPSSGAVDLNHYPEDNGWKIYAAAGGTVSRARSDSGGYGKHVIIDHGNGYQTLYAHMSAINVSQGQRVTDKTFIGRVGSTGNSSGPHLHYEQRRNGSVQRASFVDGSPVYFGKTNLQRRTNCP